MQETEKCRTQYYSNETGNKGSSTAASAGETSSEGQAVSGERGAVGAEGNAVGSGSGVSSVGDDTLEVSLAPSVTLATTFGGIASGLSGGPLRGKFEEGGFVRLSVARCGVWGGRWRWS